ncbi:MAG: hypothetical protein ACK40M_04580 [Flavobacteriales bacterium]
MKKLAIISVAMGAAFAVLALYVQFSLAPSADALEALENLEYISGMQSGEEIGPSPTRMLWFEAHEKKMNFSYIVLFGGALTALLGLVAGIKKEKMGWIGFLFGLTAFLIGAMHGTHMFS